MQFNNRKKIFEFVSNKKVIIWGARMTGIGALRKLKEQNIEVLNFVDSDQALVGKFIHGFKVHYPDELKKILNLHDNVAILIAVALKEDEILSQLQKMKIANVPVISFLDEMAPYYTVDIIGTCNLKCPSCPHSIVDTDVPKGSMSLDVFKSVFDKIIKETPSISHIGLYSWGEPLLHPYIDKIIDYVHEKNVAVALSSNLSIKFEKRIEKIIKSSPDYLKVSLSGFYPPAYDNTHQGGDINLVKNNLYLIKELLDKYKSQTLIDINYHLYKDNSGENIEQMEKLADELGFVLSKTYALVMPLERVLSHLDGKPDLQTKQLQNNLLVTIDEGIKASSEVPLPKNTCPFRENQININADLSVPVCCTVWQRDKNVVALNFLESNVSEINKNKKNVDLCNKCMNLRLPEYNMGFNKRGWEKYAKQKAITDIGPKKKIFKTADKELNDNRY
jgi:MoaA/NifB/PqqE/SkfB family radical SAM enzyme